MKLVLSLILLGLVLLLPLYVVAVVVRSLLNGLDGVFGKSLVAGKDAARSGSHKSRTRNTVLGWLFSVVLITVLAVGLPQPPDLDRDISLELVERLYNTGQSALRIEYSDSLLNDLKFDDALVRSICAGVPAVTYGSHQYNLQCAMMDNAVVGINVLDRGREVYSGTWDLP